MNSSELSTWSGLSRECFADAVFNCYAQRLLQVASERLSTRLRSKVSPEDVVQSAMRSFLRRRDEFQFENDASDGLWGLLVVITIRKCAKWADMFTADKRAVAREISIQHAGSSNGRPGLDPAGREPSPEEAAILAELVESLLQPMDPRQQQIITLRMQGYELNEIAVQVQSSRRTVTRVIAEAKDWLREYLQSRESRNN